MLSYTKVKQNALIQLQRNPEVFFCTIIAQTIVFLQTDTF